MQCFSEIRHLQASVVLKISGIEPNLLHYTDWAILSRHILMCKLCVYFWHSEWKFNPLNHHLSLFIIWNVLSSLWLSKRTSQAVITVSETHKFWHNFIAHSFPDYMCCVNPDAFWANGSSDSPVTLTSHTRSADRQRRPCLSGSAHCRPPGWFRTAKHHR